ncbi:MAG: anthranilate phosphoribosyltransferase [Planctomycetota bacterium]
MQQAVQECVECLLGGGSLTAGQAALAAGAIMDGECEAVDIAAFLTALAMRPLDSAELCGAAAAMRQRASLIPTSRSPLVDTCGTGGDRLQTFNISTAAAIVVAACGMPVAKHGNRSVSGTSGSADVLESLGVFIGMTPEQAGRCLDAVGLTFCFAPLVHGAMRHAAPVRRRLAFPTLFNLLGPLTNPAGARHQLIGASSDSRAELLAAALAGLGTDRSFVVCGGGRLDEVALWDSTLVFEVSGQNVRRFHWQAADFGLAECSVDDLRAISPADSAATIRSLLAGAPGAPLNIVLANAAAALLAGAAVTTPAAGAARAADAVHSGAALRKLDELAAWTQQLNPGP